MRYFILFFLISLFGKAQDNITWEESYRLKTEDFLQPVPGDVDIRIQGLTNAIIDVNYKQEGTAVRVTVDCFFRKSQSWIRPTADQVYTLKHEQGHFDIAEIYARKVRKKLQGMKLHKTNGEAQIKKAWNKSFKEYLEAQKEYDDATSHAIKVKKQAEWIVKIAEQLKDLEAYKNSSFLMQFK